MATKLESWIHKAMTAEINAWGEVDEGFPFSRDHVALARGFYNYADDLPEDATPATMAPLIAAWFARQTSPPDRHQHRPHARRRQRLPGSGQ